MRENGIKSFLKDTYKRSSPIPFIITGQVVVFVLIHIFDLLSDSNIIESTLSDKLFNSLSLPSTVQQLFVQPWALISHPFVYSNLFSILFDCLWLYWVGNIFLNFLNQRQFWMVFGTGILLGSILYVSVGSLGRFDSTHYWTSTTFGLASLISATSSLVPSFEIRMFLFGNVKFRTVAWIYLGFQFVYFSLNMPYAVIPYIFVVGYGILFIYQLKNGSDWSRIFSFVGLGRSRKLKIVYGKNEEKSGVYHRRKHPKDMPNQDEIDQILDKISQSGYDSLTSREKEILFTASKQDQ